MRPSPCWSAPTVWWPWSWWPRQRATQAGGPGPPAPRSSQALARDSTSNTELASRQSLRSFEPLTIEHLNRLAYLADHDHEEFTRPAGRPEYRQRRVLAVLAQGAACHYLDCLSGRDPGSRTGCEGSGRLDVLRLDTRHHVPSRQRDKRADFGVSSLGRQSYNLHEARNASERTRWRKWSAYQGRRVDLLMRALPVPSDAPYTEISQAVQYWLRRGAASRSEDKPSAWHLAQKAMVVLTPAPHRGQILWPVYGANQHALPGPAEGGSG